MCSVLSCFSSVQLCNTMDYSLPGSSIHAILQARILEWVAISFSRRSSDPGMKPTCLLSLLHWHVDSLPLAPPGKPNKYFTDWKKYYKAFFLYLWNIRFLRITLQDKEMQALFLFLKLITFAFAVCIVYHTVL